MFSMNRRVLLTSSVAAVGCLSGCISDDEETPEPYLNRIEVFNRDEVERTVNVLVLFDGEIEAWMTVTLAGADDRVASEVIEPTWPDDRTAIEVYARVEEADEIGSVTLSGSDTSVMVVIEEGAPRVVSGHDPDD